MTENKKRNAELCVLQGTSDFFKDKFEDKEKEEVENNFDKKLNLLKKKIREFLNLKNVYFLFGCGTSNGAIPTMKDLCKNLSFEKDEKDIEDEYNLIKAKNGNNLEGCLTVLYSARTYFEGLIVDKEQEDQPTDRQDEFKKKLDLYNRLIEKIEKHIFDKLNIDFTKDNERTVLEYYQTFYQKLAHRNRDNSRICVFTTNNDLFNEVAMDSLNINYVNGFSGGLRRVFNPAIFNHTWSKRMDTSIGKYEPIENLVYLYKMHGSVNWREVKEIANTYFEIEEVPRLEAKADGSTLIYPTPTKQDKSLGSPYVDLFREFQNKLLESHSVLFVIGYSFSDRHVNDIIYRALATNSSLNVVIFGEKPKENEETKKEKPIFFVDDSRIFIIYGEKHNDDDVNVESNGEIGTIANEKNQQHENNSKGEGSLIVYHFEYIVNELLPDLNAYSEDDEMLKMFIKDLKSKLRKDEDR